MMNEITIPDLEKLQLRIGKITAVKKHPRTDDYILLVDIGPVGADKQIVADLKKSYQMEQLIGKEVVLVVNTAPVVIKGIESLGLLLVTKKNGRPILISPENEVLAGVKVSWLNNFKK